MKTSIYIIIGIVITTLIGFYFISCTTTSRLSEKELAVNIVQNKASETIASSFEIIPCGSGGIMQYEIKGLSLHFQSFRAIDLNSARKLIVESSQIFLNEVNSSEAIRPYLEEYPFPPSRIDITISFHNSNNKSAEINKIAFARIRNGKVECFYGDPNLCFDKIALEETYKEALAKVEEAKWLKERGGATLNSII